MSGDRPARVDARTLRDLVLDAGSWRSWDSPVSRAEVDPFHVKHLHATILDRLGMDPNRLTYFYGGLDQKLVGVEGAQPIAKVIA